MRIINDYPFCEWLLRALANQILFKKMVHFNKTKKKTYERTLTPPIIE